MATAVERLMSELSGSIYVSGSYRASAGRRSAIVNPATDEQIAEYAHATAEEIDAAVATANAAQRAWWAMSALDRAAALHEVAAKLLELSPETGECLTREMGKPYRESNWEGG
ncbi:MAG: aldehyde dehydrogenase family protein, partial [Gammaproteobacteria bacterium]|nr:aldehyde dehydrogenase family protein [Gammaproteobacteria bacterium]